MIRQIGNKTFNLVQKKSDKNVKVAFEYKNNKWEKVFEGSFIHLKAFVKQEKKKALRELITDLSDPDFAETFLQDIKGD